jgi:tetratricopeptide (TPR) repeat protein
MFIQNSRLISPLELQLSGRLDLEYEPRFSTIGHTILTEDCRTRHISGTIFKRLDDVIAGVQAEIKDINVNTKDDAVRILETVESVVIRSNFVCSIPYYLVHDFADGLAARPIEQNAIYAAENNLRRPHIEANRGALFSYVDCDIGSLLYLSIADVVGLPLCMVEVPQHNFIRWKFTTGELLNWDTNYGFNKWTDDEYAAQYDVSQAQRRNSTYLSNLSQENVLGYFCFVRGLTFQKADQLDAAIKEYRAAIAIYPQSPSSRNNCAWLFASRKDAQTLILPEEARAFAEEACQIHRSHVHLDTLACVYAEVGDFDSAIRAEEEAYALSPDPSYRAMIDAFRQGKTYLDLRQNGHSSSTLPST